MTLLPSKKQLAFTLVELMVTISIIVVILSTASVAYLRFLNKQNLYQSGSAIESMVKDARTKAQNGFLGSEEIGFCERLSTVQISSALNADSQVVLNARLYCSDGSDPLTYDSYLIRKGITLSQNFAVSFLPLSGSNILIGGNQVSSGSATLSYDDNQVILNFDQGGNVDVRYQ